MRTLTLREYRPELAVELDAAERDALRKIVPRIQISPTPGATDRYDLTPNSFVGGVTIMDRIALEIQPKLPVARVVFMLSYALDPLAFKHREDFGFAEASTVVEAIVLAFDAHLQRAFSGGLLSGYRTYEEALSVVRGRVRFDDQLRRHFGRFPPVEARFDEFTEDTLENRLIRAAITRLRRLTLRLSTSGLTLSRYEALLERVTGVEFGRHEIPRVTYGRLNAHYRGAVEMARLILRSSSFEVGHGVVRANAFLVDMNEVFENFVVVALRETLGLSEWSFPQGGRPGFELDRARRISLEPDISWWDGATCNFVGDLKYKRISGTPDGAVGPNADLYQLLAYVTAAGLSSGTLIYAAGEREPGNYYVRNIGTQLKVRTVDADGPPREVLKRIRLLGNEIHGDRFAAVAGRLAIA
jgi:5-methylcytosine-specific restriction enzyme subunit McrC